MGRAGAEQGSAGGGVSSERRFVSEIASGCEKVLLDAGGALEES